MRRETNVHERCSAPGLHVLTFGLLLMLLASCSSSARSSVPTSTTTTTSTSMPRRDTTTEPRPARPLNVYAHSGVNMFSAATKDARSLIYVPESMSEYVDVIDPTTFRVIDRYLTGGRPQHVVPAWDMRTLYGRTISATR